MGYLNFAHDFDKLMWKTEVLHQVLNDCDFVLNLFANFCIIVGARGQGGDKQKLLKVCYYCFLGQFRPFSGVIFSGCNCSYLKMQNMYFSSILLNQTILTIVEKRETIVYDILRYLLLI